MVPDVQIVTCEFDKMAMSFDCTGFTEAHMAKTPMSIRQSDQFPHWAQNSSRIEIYSTKQMMYLGRVGGGWQVFEADNKLVDQQYGRVPDEV